MKKPNINEWRVIIYLLRKHPEPLKTFYELGEYYSKHTNSKKISNTNRDLYAKIINDLIKEKVVLSMDKGFILNEKIPYIKELLDFFEKLGKQALIDNEEYIFEVISKQDLNSEFLAEDIIKKIPELKDYFIRSGIANKFWKDKENLKKVNEVKEFKKLFKAFDKK